MLTHEFYGKYANVPISDRLHLLNFKELGLTSLDQVYKRVKELDDEMRPKIIERDRLISLSEDFILKHQAGGNYGKNNTAL